MSDERMRGTLLGLAVGDALGTTYEFDRIDQPPYPTLATGPATDVVGGGPFDLAPGAVTDDTQLAVCLAASLAASRAIGIAMRGTGMGGAAMGSGPMGRGAACIDSADLAQRYVAWSAHAFDIGNQTHAALSRIAAGMAPLAAGVDTWRASGRQAAGNGSLMRTAPLGVALAHNHDHALVGAAMTESAITHADPRCMLACAAFDVAIARAITHGADGRAMVHRARAVIDIGAAWLLAPRGDAELPALFEPAEHDIIAAAARDLAGDLDAALASDPGVYGDLHVHRTAGFVRVAFRLAFWHAVHTASWRAALIDIASRGGDADTNAAIAGALLGARDGIAAIPEAWVLRVLSATLPGPAAWAAAHHPRHLLTLLE